MSDSLLDILLPRGDAGPERVYGVVIGIVTNNDDPDGLGRVKVRFPWLSDTDESWWARIAAPMAGNGRGAMFTPEVDDEVLVAFQHGDVRFPYVLGALWNGKDAPPESKPLDGDGKVVKRVIKSRSGHVIRLDDTDGDEKIEIIDQSGKNRIVIDTGKNTITIQADSDILLQAAQGKVAIEGQSIELTSTAKDIKLESSGNLDLKASAQSNLKGSVVNIN
jgi:uncharacterized protein involved in type VI secretion and phage assembly